MPPVDRDNPVRADYSESQYSLMEFMREFPDDTACLDWLWRNRYSENGTHAYCAKCERERKFHKVKERPAWDCDSCGHHLHPLAGTIFHKSSTSLHLWFFAIHLMTSTRCGVSAKQLERELGVTYKTAWRIFTLIRNKLMADEDGPLTGEVEIDETSVDGKPRKKHGQGRLGTGATRRSEGAKLRERSRERCSPLSSAAGASRPPFCPPDADPDCTTRPWSGSSQPQSPTPTSGLSKTTSGRTSPRIAESATQPAST
jgi:transposase-like protein